MSTRFEVLKSTAKVYPNGWALCFQFGRLVHPDEDPEWGYRFIYRDPTGNLRGQRAGALLRSLDVIQELTAKARSEGWGHYDGETIAPDADPEDVLAPRKLCILDNDNCLFAGTHTEVLEQLFRHSRSGGFTGEETVEKWMAGSAERFRQQFGATIPGDDPILFVEALIHHGLYREVSIGGKVF
jgi:hypothetical protein